VARLKEHSFFAGLNWEEIERKEVEAPYVPVVRGQEDTRCFSWVYTEGRMRHSEVVFREEEEEEEEEVEEEEGEGWGGKEGGMMCGSAFGKVRGMCGAGTVSEGGRRGRRKEGEWKDKDDGAWDGFDYVRSSSLGL